MSEIKREFTDSAGDTWRPVMTMPVLIRADKKFGLKLNEIMNMADLGFEKLMKLLEVSCGAERAERGKGMEAFRADITLGVLFGGALEAMLGALAEAMPTADDTGGEATGPLESGD